MTRSLAPRHKTMHALRRPWNQPHVSNHFALLTHLEELMMCVGTFHVWKGPLHPRPLKSDLFHSAKIWISTAIPRLDLTGLGQKTKDINTTCQSITQHFILCTITIIYCQGDMFRPLLGHLQAWENRPKRYLYFNALWDPKCLQTLLYECEIPKFVYIEICVAVSELKG